MKDYYEVKIETIDGMDSNDFPDMVDAFAIEAYWKDGTSLTEQELDKLNDNHHEVVQEAAVLQCCGG